MVESQIEWLSMFKFTRPTLLYSLLALISAFVVVYAGSAAPDYVDSYYHYNAAANLASGRGFVDDYLWVYINAPESIPSPSYLYWMPGTGLLAAVGMSIFGVSFRAAQIGFALCLWGAALLAYWLGWRVGGTARHAWLGGLLMLFYGNNLAHWGQIDTYAPYALVGGGALALMGLGISVKDQNWRYWLLAGALAGLGHLLRNDGLLLLLTGGAVLLWPFERSRYVARLRWLLPFVAAYLLVMMPWFVRSLDVLGTAIPSDGLLTATLNEYGEIYSFPATTGTLDLQAQLTIRVETFFDAQGILFRALAFNGVIIFTIPLLIALWVRRRDPFMRPALIFALGVHLAFTLVFPKPAVHSSLFHAVVALVPLWAVLGLLGVDDVVDWFANRRARKPRNNHTPMKWIFALVFSGLFLGFVALVAARGPESLAYLESLQEIVPEEARVMSFDPGALRYHAGYGGVVTPWSSPTVALEIAQRYDIDYLLLRDNTPFEPMRFQTTPAFLEPLPLNVEGFALYAFIR